MIALVLSEEFRQQATAAAQQLISSGQSIVEMSDPKGHFVGVLGKPLPQGTIEIATIEVGGRGFSIFVTL